MVAIIRVVAASAFLVSSQVTAAGQTIPATVEKGLKVAVVDDSGASVEGRVQDVTPESVRLDIRGAATDIPVARIVRIERPDTVKNGALTGLGIGAALGLISTAADPQGGAVLVWWAIRKPACR